MPCKTRHVLYVQHNTEARLHNHCCCGKVIIINYYVYVFVVLVIQHANHFYMLYCLSPLAHQALSYFSTLSHKRHDFLKKKRGYVTCNVCFNFLYNFCLKHFSFYKESNFMKVCPVEADLFHADEQTDRQTDMTKLIVAFHNFANMPKNQSVYIM